MKNSVWIATAIVASLMLGACNNSGSGSVDNADSANSAKIDSGATNLNTDEAEFMVKAANTGMTEVELGKIAGDKARNGRVKDFASMMVQDHSAANDQLKTLAATKNITLPDSLSTGSKNDLQSLSKKTGNDFDKAYMKMMLTGHENNVEEFRNELNDVHNADLKQWITNTLPVLEKHLDSARAIDSIF